jgi:hypothetical protein
MRKPGTDEASIIADNDTCGRVVCMEASVINDAHRVAIGFMGDLHMLDIDNCKHGCWTWITASTDAGHG